MVGIVVVSHSHALARAAVELGQEMLHGRQVRVAVAGGLDETTFGTDAVRIAAAIEEVDDPAGVLVLMDLGSAVLSAELALDFLPPQVSGRVALCPGPLVEGLVVAMVAAAGGGSLADVAAEASAALVGKQSHLAPAADLGQPEPVAPKTAATTSTFVVTPGHGLHARPAARLVSEIRDLDAKVTLRNLTTGAGPVPAASLSRLATLGARQGHELEVAAEGRQAREAVDHVLALAARNFDDPVAEVGPEPTGATSPSALSSSAAPPGATTADGFLAGAGPLPASPGVAVGPAWTPRLPAVEIPEHPAGDPGEEWRRLRTAVAAVRRRTGRVRARTAREAGESQAAIFDAHLLLLDDAELLDQVRRGIDAGRPAEAAWDGTIREVADELAALADAYQRARAADVRSVGDQVLRQLSGVPDGIESRDGVLVAADLAPSDVSGLDPKRVRGIVLAHGSPTGHNAILARTIGIPMVVAAGPTLVDVAEGTTVALDGSTGEVAVDPEPQILADYRSRARERERLEAEALAMAAHSATTVDGVSIPVAANLGSPADARQARAAGADLAGLVRTEFLFLDRSSVPDVSEQEKAYRVLAEAMDGRRITLRTLDAGGDKPLPYLPMPPEANPFLGLRGIRLTLARRQLLRDQLIAACRVARDTPVDVMFPMVSTVDELRDALALLEEAAAVDGTSEPAAGGASGPGRPGPAGTRPGRPAGLRVGIMVEVPAAALKAAAFVPYVDFFSIGTNDLTQYTLAAERGNAAVAGLADPLDPAVLRLIDTVCRAASGSVEVAVCGEIAADETAIPVLLGLGVRELSVAPVAVPVVKRAVREVDLGQASDLAQRVLAAAGAAEARALLTASR